MKKLIGPVVTGVFFLLASLETAGAAPLSRVWVSGNGADSPSCGPLSNPCRQISYALTNNLVASGGEIDVLDPADFLPFTITQSLSVVNDGVGTASVQNTDPLTYTIVINAGANDRVLLRGLTLDGLGAGLGGVGMVNVGVVDVVGCIVRNFVEAGVYVNNVSKFNIIGSVLAKSVNDGIHINPGLPVQGAILRTTIDSNGQSGIFFDDFANGGAPVSLNLTVADSTLSRNHAGIFLLQTRSNFSASATVTRTIMSNNASGMTASGSNAKIYVSHSVAMGNTFGALASRSAAIFTLGDNSFNANANPTTGLTSDPPQ